MGHGFAVKKKKRPMSGQAYNTALKIGRVVRDCGLTRSRIHEITGVDLGAISKIMTGRHYTAQQKTIIDVLWAAGYEIELKPIDPYEDRFYSERRTPNPPLPSREEDKE